VQNVMQFLAQELILDARGWSPMDANATALRREYMASNTSMFSVRHRSMIDIAAADPYAVRLLFHYCAS
jgi:hypothetical protein